MMNQGQSKLVWLHVTIGIWVAVVTLSLVSWVSWESYQKFYVVPKAREVARQAEERVKQAEEKMQADRVVAFGRLKLEAAKRMKELNQFLVLNSYKMISIKAAKGGYANFDEELADRKRVFELIQLTEKQGREP